jgi:hypothetical protein
MKGLVDRPDSKAWDQHYRFLSSPLPEPLLPAHLISLARGVDYSRLDPRAAELFVTRLLEDWDKIPAPRFAEAIRQECHWPQALGALLEFVRIGARLDILGHGLLKKPQGFALDHWMESLTELCEIHPEEGCEQFFFGNRAFAGKASLEDATRSLTPYLRWGYISQEVPFNKSLRWQGNITLLSEMTRKLRLQEWLEEQRALNDGLPARLSVEAYRNLLGGWVSVRQAQLDLQKFKGLRATGKTRSRRYRIRGQRKQN